MGLEVLELIMDIEDKFKISISDEEACQAVTAGRLYQCVLDKVKVSTDQRCSTQKAFYLLRKALKENLGIEAGIITPKTNTVFLFPESERKKRWSKISANVPYKFPELVFSPMIGNLVVIIALISGVFGSYFLFQYSLQNNNIVTYFISFVLWIPLTVLFCVLMYRILQRFRFVIPHGCNTLGGIAKYILYHNVDFFGMLNKNEIWDKLTFIISEQLRVAQKDIKPESNFVEDFDL